MENKNVLIIGIGNIGSRYYEGLIKTNKNGIPDILALHPVLGVKFYEIKTAKGRVSKLQHYRIDELKQYGFATEIYKG